MNLLLVLCLVLCSLWSCSCFSGAAPSRKVLVTGAGGRTGKLVVEKLMADGGYAVVGMVRSRKKADGLMRSLQTNNDNKNINNVDIVVGDVTSEESLREAMAGCYGLVVCTSAVPQLKKRSLLKLLWRKATFRKAGFPEFSWSGGSPPEDVDYKGQLNQFKAAQEAKVSRVVVVSSMGGTDSENFLNKIGRKEDGTNGDILLWKRKAERALIDTGLSYGIIHPGGLTDDVKKPRKMVFDVNDNLMSRKKRSIPRDDVAALCVESLRDAVPSFSLDVVTEEVEGGKEGKVSAADVREGLDGFLEGGTKYDYDFKMEKDTEKEKEKEKEKV